MARGPESSRKFDTDDLEDISSKRKSPQSVLDKRRNSLRGIEGGNEENDREKVAQTTELEVLRKAQTVIDEIKKHNPELLTQNTLLAKRIHSLEATINPEDQVKIYNDIRAFGFTLSQQYKKALGEKVETSKYGHEVDVWNVHRDEWQRQMDQWGKEGNVSKQWDWLKNLDTEKEKRSRPFNALEESLSKVAGISEDKKAEIAKNFLDEMSTNSRNDNVRYVETLKVNIDTFNSLMGKLPKLSDGEKEKRARNFLNVSTAQQKQEIEKLKELTETEPLDVQYKNFSEARQKEHPDFLDYDKEQKVKALDEMKKDLVGEYRDSYRSASKYLAPGDEKLFESNVKQGDVAMLEASLKHMPTLIKDFARASHDKGKELEAKYTAMFGKEVVVKTFNSVGWNEASTTSLQRKELLDNKVIEKALSGKEAEKRESNAKAYKKNLTAIAGEGGKKIAKHTLMHKKGHDENHKWFMQQDTKTQNQILKNGDYVKKTLSKREKINKEHEELAPAIQKEFFNIYENLGMEERDMLNKKLKSLCKKNSKDYKKQLKKAAKDDLIPSTPEAQKKLLEDFEQLSIKEQIKSREKDKAIHNPQLEAAIRNFKLSFVHMSGDEITKALADLKELEQPHERLSFIRKFLVENHPEEAENLHKEMSEIEETDLKVIEMQGFRDKMVDKASKKAEEALEEGETKDAVELFREAHEMDPEREDVKIMHELLEESEYKNAPIPPHVMAQTEEELVSLLDHPNVKEEIQNLKLADMLIEQIEISERQHQNIKEAEKRSEQSLKDSGAEQEAVDLQSELNEFEEEKGVEEKTVLAKESSGIEAKEVIEIEFSSQKNTLLSSDPEDVEKRREVINELKLRQGKQTGLDHVHIKDEKGQVKKAEEAKLYRDQMATAQKEALTAQLIENLTRNNVPKPIAERSARKTIEKSFERQVDKQELDEMER